MERAVLEEEQKLRLENGIPLPEKRTSRSELKILVESAKVGQSVFIPKGYQGRIEDEKLRSMAANAASHVRKQHRDRAYTSLLVTDEHKRVIGARIWRLK